MQHSLTISAIRTDSSKAYPLWPGQSGSELGPWPGREGHYIANGGFKIGFGVAPKVAQVMAALVLEGRDGIPAGFRVEDSL